jgi:predicted dehydrogenase
MMEIFRFGIMGAGSIANKFCDGVQRIQGCTVAAVASKSAERAADFAKRHGIPKSYGSYREMLETEQLDGVYIAVLPTDHYRLSMLCLDYRVPVLCEKAMFMNSAEAEEVFRRSREQQTFVMEALWSRFLPANRKAKQWIEEGRIGKIRILDAAIGFVAPKGEENRYWNAALGGGAAHDLTVYAYELADYLMEEPLCQTEVRAVWGKTGVDMTDHVTMIYPEAVGTLVTTFEAPVQEKIEVCGEKGRIFIPHPHFADEAFLYDEKRELVEHFQDTVTENGFVYEIEEVISCVRAGKYESETVPQELTFRCARLFDSILETKKR